MPEEKRLEAARDAIWKGFLCKLSERELKACPAYMYMVSLQDSTGSDTRALYSIPDPVESCQLTLYCKLPY